MTEAQVKLFQMYMRENQKLGAQLDIALEALSKCADNKLLSAIVNKALVEIIKIGETTALEQKEHFADASKKIEQKE